GTALLLGGAVFALRPELDFMQGLKGLAPGAVAAMLGVALSAQSPAVVMALISETKADGPVTRTALGVVVIADLVVIVLYAMTSTLVQGALGGRTDPLATMRDIAWELFGSMGIGTGIGVVLALYLRNVRPGGGRPLFVLLVCVVASE